MAGISEGRIATLLSRVVACFRSERVSYVLIGAWTLAVWGRPRATNDVDFLVLVKEEDFGRLSERMTQAGMALDETWTKWNPMLRGVQLRFQFQGISVDLLRPRDAHDRQIFQRRRRKRLDGHSCWLVAPKALKRDFIEGRAS